MASFKIICKLLFMTMAMLAVPAMAAAIPEVAIAAKPIDFTNAGFIQTSGPTSVPYAAVDLCHRIVSACPSGEIVQPAVHLTTALWRQLLTVNSFYNTTIIPMTDMQQYHIADFWTYPDSGYGDCEDYQLAKQRQLIRQGWPQSDLLMAVVRDHNNQGHAVLIVRTDRGDLVLDNQDSLIRLWSDTSYTYLKRQSQGDASEWVGLIDNHQTIVEAKRSSGTDAPSGAIGAASDWQPASASR
jgi:predicted transglutaminase-like cysteine proteinase